MHSGEGVQGCTIYTGTAGVAYMFLRLAESLDHIQHKMADHPKEPFAKLHSVGLLKRADEYGHWAKHLSHGGHQKVLPCLAHLSFTTETSLHCIDAKEGHQEPTSSCMLALPVVIMMQSLRLPTLPDPYKT